ncbi:MAG: sulfite exporter TauE/SafE family protein [Clostridia bacterium]|nr:sulfite exporter TauE/SafE family protein [Clostridia bacterium]
MWKKSALVLGGVVAGFINGFLGGGGGVVIVSLLLSVLKLDQKKSQATALLVILPLTVVSAVVYVVYGNVDWRTALFTTIGVVAGGIVGALLLKKLDSNVVKMIFAIVLILGGVKMFF